MKIFSLLSANLSVKNVVTNFKTVFPCEARQEIISNKKSSQIFHPPKLQTFSTINFWDSDGGGREDRKVTRQTASQVSIGDLNSD